MEINEPFDFEEHGRKAEETYRKARPLYQAFAESIKHILTESLRLKEITVQSVDSRAKETESFRRKSQKISSENPEMPKYGNPLSEITDLAGIRVITFFPRTIEEIEICIEENFHVIEKTNKSDELAEEGKFGYQSVHYLISLKSDRTGLFEYQRYSGLVAEIQLRTILQHAWAEMEHDIQYKSLSVIPTSISRRFLGLASIIEIADREFQAIQDEDERIRSEARKSVNLGKLDEVEITPDSAKAYLDYKFGSDGRMSRYSYEWTARMLRKIGFLNFAQVDQCIQNYDSDEINRILWSTRQGQITRFEDTLLAGMGEKFRDLHPWASSPWFIEWHKKRVERLRGAQISVGDYQPKEVE